MTSQSLSDWTTINWLHYLLTFKYFLRKATVVSKPEHSLRGMAEQDSEAGFSVLCIPFAVPALWGSGNHREYRKRGKEQRQITSGCCKENGFDFTGTPQRGLEVPGILDLLDLWVTALGAHCSLSDCSSRKSTGMSLGPAWEFK